MKLYVQTAGVDNLETLRALLIDAMDELTGSNSQLLEPKLPWDGYLILVADAELHPVLISFDPVNSRSALLNGLQATEQIATALPWVNQVYTVLDKQQRPPRLVVISPDPPPGAAALLAGCPGLKLFSYKILRVSEETGLLLEPVGTDNATSTGMESGTEPPARATTGKQVRGPVALPPLSKEENTYFQQL